jgi:hypothetical protein
MTGDVDETVMRFAVAPASGSEGFTVLRGYARPYSGPAPITTVNSTINNITGSAGETTVINNAFKNTLLVIDSDFDTFITISNNTGVEATDWVNGDFFSVLQLGDGKVEIRIESGGTITPSPGFTNFTRGKGSIVSVTNYNASINKWASSGDLQQATVEALSEHFMFVVSDETTALTTGVSKFKMRMPYALSLTDVRASLTTAQASGSVFTVDILVNGTSILSTKITIDNTKLSSHSSVNQPVVATPILADDDEVRVDITQIGTSGATGLKVYLLGLRA